MPPTQAQRRCTSSPQGTAAASPIQRSPAIPCFSSLSVLSKLYLPPLSTKAICCLGQDTLPQFHFHLHELLNTIRTLKKKTALKGKKFPLPLLNNNIGSFKFSDSNYRCIFPIWHPTVTDGNVKNK